MDRPTWGKSILLLSVLSTAALRAQFPEIPQTVLPAATQEFDDGQDPMRVRLFQTTTTRRQLDLGGWWDFATDPAGAGDTRGYERNFPVPEARLWVPGTWNVVARYWNYTGPAWYRRRFEAPLAGTARIRFGSVFYLSKIWLDGRLLGEHEGGYLPFDYTVTGLSKGPHTLVLRVDNRLTDKSLPKKNVDWFPYGGIERPVYLEFVPDVFIERVHVIPTWIPPAGAALKARVWIRNLTASATDAAVSVRVDGREVVAVKHRAVPGENVVELDAKLPAVKLWSPEDPHLYSAQVRLDGGRDDQFARFGVREVRTEGARILLNGHAIKLLGANRHEDHPEWGSASPPQLLRQDIEILKRLGVNAVRAHYPLPELFMDFCDQYGILFLSEVPAWQYSTAQLGSPEIQAKMMRNFGDMVARDMNHPSVLSWSLGNEWPEPDRSYDIIRDLIARARRLDPTRLVTFVTGGPHVWRIHALVDVIAVNWARYQWYDPFTTLDRTEGDKSAADLLKIHARYPGKPVILTEFGGAEAQAGWHNWGNVKWSEEFQARNVEDSALHGLEQDWISGGCVWQFSDSRSAPERFLAGRLHGWNGKGIVDAYRNPKTAFYALERIYREYCERVSGDLSTAGRQRPAY